MRLSRSYLHGSGGCEKPRLQAAGVAKKKFGTPEGPRDLCFSLWSTNFVAGAARYFTRRLAASKTTQIMRLAEGCRESWFLINIENICVANK